MATAPAPSLKLAEATLPGPLFRGLCHVFAQGLSGCALAGGTSLAGFYAAHRRSDDLDLFTENDLAQRAAVLAVKSLPEIGVKLRIRQESAQFFAGNGELDGHLFQITVVLDANLFRVCSPVALAGGIRVVDLDTLFKMKAATLVSRCSEKDLYDLLWLFARFPERTFADLIRLGSEIDGGVNGENILSSVAETILRKNACGFALDGANTAERIYAELLGFRKALIQGVQAQLEGEPAPALGELVRKLQKLKG